MHLKLALAALAAAEFGTTTAAPTTGPTRTLQKRSFGVQRVAGGPANRNALKLMKKAMNKYGFPMPGGLAEANEDDWAAAPRVDAGAAAASASPSATPSAGGNGSGNGGGSGGQGQQVGNVTNNPVKDDVEFVSPITVGGQKMMMDFDTGSSDLWLFSTSLSPEAQQGHQVFDPTKSPTFKQQQGSSFFVTFGDGSAAKGNVVGTDNVDIGGATAQGQTVELASEVAPNFIRDTQSNGLVGLAFSKINQVKPQQATTFFDTIHNQLKEPILAANLKHGTAGSYSFGEIDPAAFTGQLQSAPVDNSKGFWQFESNKFAVGNGQVQTNPQNTPAIADTGTTLMLVDDAVALQYYKQVPGAAQDPQTGMFIFPCNAQLPDFHVALGPSNLATIPGSLINFQSLQQQGAGAGAKRRRGLPSRRDILLDIGVSPAGQNQQAEQQGAGQQAAGQQGAGQQGAGQQGAGQQACVGGLQGNQGQPIQIYGDIMFKAQYAVFNLGNNTVSFAPHA